MFYDAIANTHGLSRNPFKALVGPRPIGWISSLSPEGHANLAPYSFFNAMSSAPPYVVFGSDGYKDSKANIEATGEFVCNVATYDLRMQMNQTSAHVPPDTDEFDLAGVTKAPSQMVAPPRVAESPVALECKYVQTVELPASHDGHPNAVLFGKVVGIYIADDVIVDGLVDVTRYRPIARLGYMDYAVVDEIFSIDRPVVAKTEE